MLAGLFDPRGGESNFHDDLVDLLVGVGASRRSAEMLVLLRGLAGAEPQSLRAVSKDVSAERVRQLVRDLELGPLAQLLRINSGELALLKGRVADALMRIEKYAPASDGDIQTALAAELDPLQSSPASVLRIAEILLVNHDLRLTKWTSRAKFSDRERTKLATPTDKSVRETVTGIVPSSLPDEFANFINFARRFSRGSGVVAAGQIAQLFTDEMRVAMAPNEATAYLRPFSVHLGWHDGDDWFCFFNSANDFVRKVATRVDLFGRGSFQAVFEFHQRFNRSKHAGERMTVPETVLRVALELAGFSIVEDEILPMPSVKAMAGRGVSDTQVRMIAIFRELLEKRGGQKSVRRDELIRAMQSAGIRESTARVYLSNQGLFVCSGNLCRLADSQDAVPGIDPKVRRGPGRPPKIRQTADGVIDAGLSDSPLVVP